MKIRDLGASYLIEVPVDVLEQVTSPYQQILVGNAGNFGKVLVLDGEVQFSEADQHIYHECLGYPPALMSEGKDFLILGGGDGLLANVLKRFTSPENITVVDLDAMVVDVCKRHFSDLGASALDEVDLRIGDALKFNTAKKYDVVFVDLVDYNVAPHLYSGSALNHYKSFLKHDGILATHSDYIYSESIVSAIAPEFDHSLSYAAYVPSFFSLWNFHLFSDASFRVDLLDNVEGTYFSKKMFWSYRVGALPLIDEEEQASIEE